jgi:hypothetical protein
MSLDNYTWVPAGARHTYKDDHGSSWTTYKSHGQMPNNQKTPHQVFLAHGDRDEQYFFQDADDARWFWVQGYKGSLFLHDDKTLLPFDRMTLWIDDVEVDSRRYERKEEHSLRGTEEPTTTTSANAATTTKSVGKTEDTKCLNGSCGSGELAAQLEVMGFADGKPLITNDYCSEKCYREVQGEFCLDILGRFMERLGQVGDDLKVYVVYDRPDGGMITYRQPSSRLSQTRQVVAIVPLGCSRSTVKAVCWISSVSTLRGKATKQ